MKKTIILFVFVLLSFIGYSQTPWKQFSNIVVSDSAVIQYFRMKQGAVSGYYLKCDGVGKASWVNDSISLLHWSDTTVIATKYNLHETFFATALQTAFPTSFTATAWSKVYMNRQRVTLGFSVVAGVITFTYGLLEGTEVTIDEY